MEQTYTRHCAQNHSIIICISSIFIQINLRNNFQYVLIVILYSERPLLETQ